MSKSAVYLRVSSKTQTTASQAAELGRWMAAERAAGAVLDEHRDQFTGATMDRPGWNALWAGVLRGDYARVIVWRLDRLGRTARGLCELFEELRKRRVDLVSLRDGFTLDSPSGRLHARIVASVAEFELEVRSERQAAGIAAAKERGVKFGRPKCEAGKAAKRIKVTPEQIVQVQRLYEGGGNVAAIARACGLSRPTVYSILRRSTVVE